MGIELICFERIERGKMINIPEKSNCYKEASGNVRFFFVNPTLGKKMKWNPKDAKSMTYIHFHKHGNRYINYGKPLFYDSDVNIIN